MEEVILPHPRMIIDPPLLPLQYSIECQYVTQGFRVGVAGVGYSPVSSFSMVPVPFR